MNVWARWGMDLLLFKDLSPQGLALAVNFFLSTTLMFFGILLPIATTILLWI